MASSAASLASLLSNLCLLVRGAGQGYEGGQGRGGPAGCRCRQGGQRHQTSELVKPLQTPACGIWMAET